MDKQLIFQLLLIIAVFYFLFILPNRKRVKKEKSFESNLKSGDKIITKSGIHGKVSEIQNGTIVMETMAGKLRIEKSAISMDLSLKAKNAVKDKK